MLDRGWIALLFDGFDELAQRVTYDRAAEHFDTLLEAAVGLVGKVVVTSRTQHFLTDSQVKQEILKRAESRSGLRLVRLQPFDSSQVRQFLDNYFQDQAQRQRVTPGDGVAPAKASG